MAFERIDLYIGLVINGIFTGLGTAIGVYFAQNKIIKRLESLETKLITDMKGV
jgi:hypothetical protein